MKKTIILLLFFSVMSCENNITLQSVLESNDIEQIKLKRKEIAASKEKISNQLQIIDDTLEAKLNFWKPNQCTMLKNKV